MSYNRVNEEEINLRNEFEVLGDVTEIYLKRRKGESITTKIDTEDLKRLMRLDNTWYSHWSNGTGTYYVAAKIPGSEISIRLHRFLLNDPSGKVVDHINHDTLDNRKNNLRPITSAENAQNRKGAARHNVTNIRGVIWDRFTNKWRAVLRVDGKQIHLGRFNTIEEANEIVTAKRKELMKYS